MGKNNNSGNSVNSDDLSPETGYRAFGSPERPNGINGTGRAKGRKGFPTELKKLLSGVGLSCWRTIIFSSLRRT